MSLKMPTKTRLKHNSSHPKPKPGPKLTTKADIFLLLIIINHHLVRGGIQEFALSPSDTQAGKMERKRP